MRPSPHVEYIPLVPISAAFRHPLVSQTSGSATSFRRKLPMLRLLRLPFALLTLYFLLPFLVNRPKSTPPPEYLSHAGRPVLETTIVLPKLQHRFASNQGGDDERRQKVKESIKRTWDLYVREAWGWDEVRPSHGGGHDTRYRASEYVLMTEERMGCDDCRWLDHVDHCWIRRGIPCRIGIYDLYRFRFPRWAC